MFDSSHDQRQREHNRKLKELRTAIDESQFILHYQPRVHMRTGEVLGFEALLRWQHPELGLRSPADFLPILDGHELLVDLGHWVLRHAFEQLALWQRQGMNLSISINVDAIHLEHPTFVDRLRTLLVEFDIDDPSLIELEVLETSALENIVQFQDIIADCHELGIRFSLDDFGTGYSSLSYLKRIPVDTLKIDQSFVRDMLDDPDDLAILEGVLGLSQAFRREVVAEGVESESLGKMLLQLGCCQAQGYAIARPMPAESVDDWITQWRTYPSWSQAAPLPPEKLPLLFGLVDLNAWYRSLTPASDDKRSNYSLNHYEHHFNHWLNRLSIHENDNNPLPGLIREHHETFKQLIREMEHSDATTDPSHFDMLQNRLDTTYRALHRLMSDSL
nr:EAL domain-containing protein [Saccharospirillum salsuginis]